LALAAYNAGGSRVDRWLKEFSNADMPEFVEQIPFSETRGYVKQVLSNQAIYGLLTSSAAAANPGINYDKTYALTEGRTIH
jgi:soluble lytic murein transglycosylase-like protein